MGGSGDGARDFMKWALGGSSGSKVKKDEHGNGYFERKPSHYSHDIRTSSSSTSSRHYDSRSSHSSSFASVPRSLSGSGSGSSSGSRYYNGKDYTLPLPEARSGSESESYHGRTDYSSYYSASTVAPEDSVSQAGARKVASKRHY
jgi:hypothetical protein